ncbi:MAG: hypothetical protein DRO88_06410 [Promethearchaeia archaeon]|nr:MAG: hypothetical protein DRO88_06410 [Candidatus Lokiarchaeia archaeon]
MEHIMTPSKQLKSSGLTSVVGKIMKVSSAFSLKSSTKQRISDIYLLGIKTREENRIMFILSTHQLGWFGEQKNSIVWWWNKSRKCEIKASIKNLERYIGTKIRVEGVLETIDAEAKKFRLRNVQKVVLFL